MHMRVRHFFIVLTALVGGILVVLPTPSLAASTLFSTKTRLVQVKGQPQVYAIVDGKKHYIRSLDSLHSYAFLKKSIEPITEKDLNNLSEANLIMSPLGPRVYVLDAARGAKLWIPNEESFVKGGHKWENIVRVTGADSRSYRNVQLVKSAENNIIYYLDNDHPERHEVTNTSDLAAAGLSESVIMVVPQPLIDGYALGTPFSPTLIVTPPVSAGTLTVTAGTEPASSTIPAGTIRNVIWRVDFAAQSAPVTVYSITVSKRGVISENSVERLRLVDTAGNALGNPLKFADGKAKFVFPQPILVQPGQPKTFRFVAGFSGVGTQATFALALVSAQDINANTPVVGSFPMMSAEHHIIAGTGVIGKLVVTPADLSSTERSIIVGSANQALARFVLSAKGGNENILLDRLQFTILGGADATSFTKYRLVDDLNKTVTAVFTPNGYRLTVDMSKTPYTIVRGESRTLTLRADVSGGQDRSAQFTLQGDEDIEVHGATMKLNILPSAGAPSFNFPVGSGTNGVANTIAIKPGQVTMALSTTSPTGAIPRGSRAVVLAVYEIRTLGQAMRWESVGVRLTTAGSNTPLDGVISLREKGKSAFGTVDANAVLNDIKTAAFSPQPIIAAGKTLIVEVVADIPQAAKLGDVYQVTLSDAVFTAITGGGRITFSSAVSSAARAVQELSLSIRLDPKFVPGRVVAGQKKIKIGRFLMQTSGGEAIKVEQVTLATTSAANLQFSNGFSNLKFGNVTIATPTGTPYIFTINASLAANRETGYDVYIDTALASGNQTISLALQEVVAYGATSRAPVAVQSDGQATPILTVAKTIVTVASDAAFVGGVTAKTATAVLGKFVVTASAAEDIIISQVVIAEAGGSSGFSVSRGYKNLKLTNAATGAALSGTIASPAAGAGGNPLTGFKVKASQAITVNVVADTTGAAAGDTIQLVVLSITARGVTSTLTIPIADLPSTMVAVSF